MPRPKVGLRVKYCENVADYHMAKDRSGRIVVRSRVPDGWFILAWVGKRWQPLMDLRFAREKDAMRAAVALTAAGLDSVTGMRRAGAMEVKRIACECLQW